MQVTLCPCNEYNDELHHITEQDRDNLQVMLKVNKIRIAIINLCSTIVLKWNKRSSTVLRKDYWLMEVLHKKTVTNYCPAGTRNIMTYKTGPSENIVFYWGSFVILEEEGFSAVHSFFYALWIRGMDSNQVSENKTEKYQNENGEMTVRDSVMDKGNWNWKI